MSSVTSLEDTIATALKEAPEQGDWPWKDHCEGVAMFVAGALRAAGAVPAEPANHDTPIAVSRRTLEAAINCVEACATDRREPERYREWYAEALADLRAAVAAVDGEAPAT